MGFVNKKPLNHRSLSSPTFARPSSVFLQKQFHWVQEKYLWSYLTVNLITCVGVRPNMNEEQFLFLLIVALLFKNGHVEIMSFIHSF